MDNEPISNDPADYTFTANGGCPYCSNPDPMHLESYPCRVEDRKADQ